MIKPSQPQLLALRALSALGGKATAAQVYRHLHPAEQSNGHQFDPVHRTLKIMDGSPTFDRGWTRDTGKTIEWWTVWEITEKGRVVLAENEPAKEPAGLFGKAAV